MLIPKRFLSSNMGVRESSEAVAEHQSFSHARTSVLGPQSGVSSSSSMKHAKQAQDDDMKARTIGNVSSPDETIWTDVFAALRGENLKGSALLYAWLHQSFFPRDETSQQWLENGFHLQLGA